MMMRVGTLYQQGEILLIPIPFSDLSSQKQRPVIVISNNEYNQKTRDIIVVAMTSNPVAADYSPIYQRDHRNYIRCKFTYQVERVAEIHNLFACF